MTDADLMSQTRTTDTDTLTELMLCLQTLLRDCMATKPSQRPEFSDIKERLRRMNEAVARGGKLEEEPHHIEPSRHSYSRSKSSQPRRSSIEEVGS